MIRCATLTLGLLAVAAAGCALKPVESPGTDDCGAPLHRVSTSDPKLDVDPDIESLLGQETHDLRLMQINRRMYQGLRALDVELRREERVAACKQPSMDASIIEAQAAARFRAAPGSAAASASQSSLTSPGAAGSSGVGASSMTGSGPISALRKATMSPGGAGGNGATAPKIVPGSDNDIVALRLRKAAEQETDPALRAKLWKEYKDYRQGTAVAK